MKPTAIRGRQGQRIFHDQTRFSDGWLSKFFDISTIFWAAFWAALFELVRERSRVREYLMGIFHEFILCARSIGFYAGITLFVMLIAVKNTLFIDLFSTIGEYQYLLVTFLVLASVLMHGAARQLNIVHSRRLLNVVGFVFSSEAFLFASFLIVVFFRI